MKIEIWADVVCPYCYLGKRRLELALADTTGVDVVWHSFQLDPSLETQGGKSLNDYVAELRGQPREWAVRIHQQLVEDGKEVGLEYDFDKAVVANSFDAHRLIHLAKARGRGNEAEDRLFRAYFAEGKNIADHATLASLGKEIGLESADVEKMLGSKAFSKDVLAD